ncbi:MAG: response regulator [Spirochaetales bacterium]
MDLNKFPESSSSNPLESKKILLVEDEPIIALSEALFLKKQGYEVLTVSTGEAAVKKIKEDPSIDLILMDIDLGKGIDGTEAARQILLDREVPILFLSSHSEKEIVDRTFQIGAYGYVWKSAGETVLSASLKMAFRLAEVHKKQTETEAQVKLQSNLYKARLTLLEYSFTHEFSQILTKAVDLVTELTASPLGFFHALVQTYEGSEAVQLQTWSTQTLEQFCKINENFTFHYPLDKAGVWADCARYKKPIIHNSFPDLSPRKGYPEGHPTILRELTVPIMVGETCKGIIGVGNKATPYTSEDVEIVQKFADLSWDILERKRIEESLFRSEQNYKSLLKELRHRLRSSFHQITSLASIQAAYQKTEETREALLDLRNRVSVMADLYDVLEEESTRSIGLGKLTEKICNSLTTIFKGERAPSLNCAVEGEGSLEINPKIASAYGLILNEIVTNAFRHAFPGGQTGTIDVSLRREGEKAVLKVQDTGIGLDVEKAKAKPTSLGLELIETLVAQIGATFQLGNRKGESGTCAVLAVPLS